MVWSNHPGASVLMQTWVECGLREVVISPGSRNAPLVIAACAHPELRVITALDERAAAHVALGLALKTNRPAAVVCTSGTAAVNHGPAIAEAFFSHVPLLSVTADRAISARSSGPGQMVHQTDLFRNHTVASLEIDEASADALSIEGAALTAWEAAQHGPVHVNVPFEEPLYGTEAIERNGHTFSKPAEVPMPTMPPMPEGLIDALSCHSPRVLVHIGGLPLTTIQETVISELEERFGLIVDGFACAQQEAESCTMRWLCGWDEACAATFEPQAIVTVGLPPMDKKFRAALKAWNAPHYHLGTEDAWDMFGSLSGHWKASVEPALNALIEAVPPVNSYAQQWSVRKAQLEAVTAQATTTEWVDFEVYRWLARHLPEAASVHFANSTSARYAQWFDWKGNRLHANRGVAGIDGCLSTAVGDALQTPSMPTFLISGDAAWLYDSNGLLVEPRPEAFKAIVMNNGGGNIFRWLDGPAESGLLERHFEAPFAANVSGSAVQLGLHYTAATDWDSLSKGFDNWLNNDAPGLLEIQTPGAASAAYMKAMLERISTAMNRFD